MKNCNLYYLINIFTHFVTETQGGEFYTVLKVQAGSGFKVFDVWNLRNMFCGTPGTTPIFRHDYIDHFDPKCVQYLKVVFENDQTMSLKYYAPGSNVLETILRKQPVVSPQTPESTYGYVPTNPYSGYEFALLNYKSTMMYAAIYYNNTNKAPQFLYNVKGSKSSHNDPTRVQSIRTASYIQIGVVLKDYCPFLSTNQWKESCSVKNKKGQSTKKYIRAAGLFTGLAEAKQMTAPHEIDCVRNCKTEPTCVFVRFHGRNVCRLYSNDDTAISMIDCKGDNDFCFSTEDVIRIHRTN